MSVNYGPAALKHQRDLLAQAIWDAREALGLDNDGDPTPGAAIAGQGYRAFAANFVADCKQVAADHDAALDEIPVALPAVLPQHAMADGRWCQWSGVNVTSGTSCPAGCPDFEVVTA